VARAVSLPSNSFTLSSAALVADGVDFGVAAERLLRARGDRLPEPPALSILEVEDRLRAVAGARGPGSRAAKTRVVADLFAALTPVEAKYVAKNLIREMRTGVAEGVVIDALALLAGGDRAAVARAHLLEGDLPEVAARVVTHRGGTLPESTVAYFRPVRPMLAHTAESATASSGFVPASSPYPQGLPARTSSLMNGSIWLTLMGKTPR